MLSLLRRYWPVVPIAAIFAAGVFFEWKSATGPHQQTYAAAPQIPTSAVASSAPSQPIAQPQPTANTNSSKPAEHGGFPWESFWVFCTFAATATLATFAVRQFEETRQSNERQLRAYLSVVIGGAIYQERQKPLRFEARPMILNNGATPAYKVRFRATAKIIPNKIAETYQFKMPEVIPLSQASIGPKENRFMSAIYPRYIPDYRVPKVMNGDGIALWTWGVVEYEDAFGKPRFTEFCQRLYWVPDGKGTHTIFGNYDARFGRSN